MSSLPLVSNEELTYFYQDHSSWLQNLLCKRLGDRCDAADIMQDIFVKLLIKPRSFDNKASARAYLSCMAKGMCIDLWRRRELEKAWFEALSVLPEPIALSAEHHTLIFETLLHVEQMLRKLPKKVCQAFLMSQIQGLTYIEIANHLGVSERMVKKYMAQAMLQCVLFVAKHEI